MLSLFEVGNGVVGNRSLFEVVGNCLRVWVWKLTQMLSLTVVGNN